jgi:hypothetical protein
MMTEPVSADAKQADDFSLLRTVEQFNIFFVVLLTLFGWYLSGWHCAKSVLIGGILSGGSFFVLKRTMMQIVSKIAVSDAQRPAAGFAVKFYIRLMVLVLLLAVVSMSISIHLIGLVVGLSTVMVSVIFVTLARGLMEFSGKHAKGA